MGSLLSELKRRKVFRVAAVYAVVAWLLIQVADTVAPMLTLPDYVPRLVLFLLVILFPVALFLAWAYELSPEGVKADSGEEPAPTPGRNLFTAVFVSVAVLAGLGLYLWNQPEQAGGDPEMAQTSDQSDTGAPAGLEKSIAVLPFNAFSANPSEQYFADGLADTLLHKLAQLRDIRVISRTSSFQYRGEAVDVRQVGEELQVATVLEGSVQRSGDRLRIIAQLVNTDDGGHLWSQTFDRSDADIFAIHDEISEAVVQSLEVTLSPEERDRLTSAGTESAEAANLLATIEARTYADNFFELSMEEFQSRIFNAIEEVERRVLTIDPDFADAHYFIAKAYSDLVFQASDQANRPYFVRKAFAALNRAMLLDRENPRYLTAFSGLHRREGDFATAEVFARMALDRTPNDASATRSLNLSLASQHKNAEESLALAEREAELDPNAPALYRRIWFALGKLGRLEDATELIESQLANLDFSPQLAASDLMLVKMGRMGQHVEAMESVIDVRRSLEDEVGDVLLEPWVLNNIELGNLDEIEKIAPRLEGSAIRAFVESELIARDSGLRAANSALTPYLQGPVDPVLHREIARRCVRLRDYECAIDSYLNYRPELRTTALIEPSFDRLEHFEAAIPLAFALRANGEADNANKLLEHAYDWYRVRADQSYFSYNYYSLPEMFLLLGDTQQALDLIRERVMLEGDNFIAHCVSCGFDWELYDPLRDNPEFQELVAEYERRKTVNRERVQALIAEAGF